MLIRLSLAAAAIAVTSAASAQTAPAATAAPQQVTKTDFLKNVDSRFSAMDANHDGSIDKTELTAIQAKALAQAKAEEQQQIDAEFKKLDTNHNGSLSPAEFNGIARTPQAPSVDEAINALDTNKDGKISAAEFRAPKAADFDKADLNHDGTLTVQELAAARGR